MTIRDIIGESVAVKQAVLKDEHLLVRLRDAVGLLTRCYRNGGKVLLCGNGGSAADAQHIAAELSGRFYRDRQPLDAEALHVNTSYLTAVANDYSYDEVFARLIRARGREGDVLIALSTSGNSGNILHAATAAARAGMTVIGMTGETGGSLADACDLLLNVPSLDTARIQEVHILFGHIICQLVEDQMFGEG